MSLPYPRTKTEVVIAKTTVLEIPNSFASWPEAGAIIDEETGEMNVKAETMRVAIHFFLYDQLHKATRRSESMEVKRSS